MHIHKTYSPPPPSQQQLFHTAHLFITKVIYKLLIQYVVYYKNYLLHNAFADWWHLQQLFLHLLVNVVMYKQHISVITNHLYNTKCSHKISEFSTGEISSAIINICNLRWNIITRWLNTWRSEKLSMLENICKSLLSS